MSRRVVRRRFLQTVATYGAAMACGDRPGLWGAEPPSDPAGDDRAAWEALFDRTAKGYEIYRDPEHTQPLRLRPEPVYKWRAASAGDRVYGAIYVWTYRGSAEAVVCFWRFTHSLVSEAHSLSTVVLSPVANGKGEWRPKVGVTRHPLPDAPKVAERPTARLAQMRRLAGDFSGHTEAGDKSERRQLRVLSAPLYRYESTDPQVIWRALRLRLFGGDRSGNPPPPRSASNGRGSEMAIRFDPLLAS